MVVEHDLAALAQVFADERPLYEELAGVVADRLKQALKENGIKADVRCRAKTVTSLLGKVLRKGYSDPVNEIHDRAGARATVTYLDYVQPASECVHATFNVLSEDDKLLNLGDKELGYLGVHFEVTLPETDDEDEFNDRICEIQLHTQTQTAWAEVSHDLLYKSGIDPPVNASRRIMRLQALFEIADEQTTQSRKEILGRDGVPEARLLTLLEPHFRTMTTDEYDNRLSLELLEALLPLLSPSERADPEALIESFVNEHRDKLCGILEEYREDQRVRHFLFQPSILLLFERITRDPLALEEKWTDYLPLSLLTQLSTIWGDPIPAA